MTGTISPLEATEASAVEVVEQAVLTEALMRVFTQLVSFVISTRQLLDMTYCLFAYLR